MRLADLHPTFYDGTDRDAAGAYTVKRVGLGVIFDCPCCVAAGKPEGEREVLAVPFANPLDGGAAHPNGRGMAWQRTGESFETLTLTPSVDASHWSPPHWHGFITNGEVR